MCEREREERNKEKFRERKMRKKEREDDLRKIYETGGER